MKFDLGSDEPILLISKRYPRTYGSPGLSGTQVRAAKHIIFEHFSADNYVTCETEAPVASKAVCLC